MSAAGEAGFTLIEALVVLAVSALVAGIAFPSIERMSSTAEWRTGVATIDLAVREARAQAVSGGGVAVLRVVPGRGIGTSPATLAALPGALTVSLPRSGIAFYADGTTSGGVIQAGLASARRAWRIDPATGAVTGS